MIIYLNMLETEADREIFQKLYEENKPMLWHIARKIVRNEADAEDAVHNCFLRLAENFSRYRNQSYSNLIRLCKAISRNAATDIAREYRKEGDFQEETGCWEDDVVDISPDVLDKLIEQYEKNLLDRAVKKLAGAEKDLIFLQYGLGMKPKEIGKMLNMTSAMVRKRMCRCRNKLVTILEGEEYESLR